MKITQKPSKKIDYQKQNVALIKRYRKLKDENLKYKCIRDFYNLNNFILYKYVPKYPKHWVFPQAYLHLPKIFDLYNLDGKMSVLGYWLQRLAWKLPEEWNRENALIMPPAKPTKEERESLKDMKIHNVSLDILDEIQQKLMADLEDELANA